MRFMVAPISVLVAAFAMVAATAGDALAQSGRTSGSGRTSSSLQQGYTGNSTQGRLPFSASAGARGSQSARGRGGAGQQGLGAGGMGGQAGGEQGPLNSNLAQTGAERFQQGGFVGRDAADVRQGFQNQGRRGGGQMLDQMIENLNEMRDSRRRWREQNAAPPPVRVQLQPTFDMPPELAATGVAHTRARLGAVMQRTGVVSPQVQLNGRMAMLRGTVATEHDRLLAGQLAALEPGVSQVENLLTIQTPPAAPQ